MVNLSVTYTHSPHSEILRLKPCSRGLPVPAAHISQLVMPVPPVIHYLLPTHRLMRRYSRVTCASPYAPPRLLTPHIPRVYLTPHQPKYFLCILTEPIAFDLSHIHQPARSVTSTPYSFSLLLAQLLRSTYLPQLYLNSFACLVSTCYISATRNQYEIQNRCVLTARRTHQLLTTCSYIMPQPARS